MPVGGPDRADACNTYNDATMLPRPGPIARAALPCWRHYCRARPWLCKFEVKCAPKHLAASVGKWRAGRNRPKALPRPKPRGSEMAAATATSSADDAEAMKNLPQVQFIDDVADYMKVGARFFRAHAISPPQPRPLEVMVI